MFNSQLHTLSKRLVKVPHPDIKEFSDMVLKFPIDSDYRKSLGREGQRFAKRNLSWDAGARFEMEAITPLGSKLRT